MKEIVRDGVSLGGMKLSDLLREVARQLLSLGAGFLLSRGEVFGGLFPFGVAYAAAVPMEYLAAAAFGCVVGYLLPADGLNYFRYLAALFAVVAIKALLTLIVKGSARPPLAALTAGVVVCVTGLVSSSGETVNMLLAVAEAVLSLGGAFFLSHGFDGLSGKGRGLRGVELACALISANLLLIGLMPLAPGGISVGKILACAFLLLVSRFGHAPVGAMCGVVSGFAAALAGGGLTTAVTLAFAGLISGVFASFGKYAQVAAFIIGSLSASAVGGSLSESAELLIVSLFGSALFLMVPKAAANALGNVFAPPAKTVTEDSIKKSVTMRLGLAAGALSDVSDTVETVARELSRINSPDFNWVLRGIEKEACAGCSLCLSCWETRRADTVSDILESIKSVREGAAQDAVLLPEELKGRCLRPGRVGEAVYKYYSDYASRMAAESRISDVRSVVSEQFDGISSMLRDMAAELDREEAFDDRTAAKLAEALKNIDIQIEESSCRIDRFGRMTVELGARAIGGTKYNRMKILRQVEVCCDRDFEPPTLTESGGKVYITLTEKALLTVSCGVCQLACSVSGISGDAYSTFYDGKGRFFMVLSDGMGTGGRAAVDGAMASGLMTRLLKAGFGYDCSLGILNSAMLFKSTDESLATVDVACIDLFSGRTELLKAGAAPTLVRRSGKCAVASSTSLPAGILREVGFDKAVVKLKKGDLIVLVSDGVTGEGTDWICAELESWQDTDPRQLAEHLAHCAKRRRQDGHGDDITVLAAMVERAV